MDERKRDYTYALFEYYYQRAKLRFYDFREDQTEDIAGELNFTLITIWAHYVGTMSLPNGAVKYMPTMRLSSNWIEKRVYDEYGRFDAADRIATHLMLFNEKLNDGIFKIYKRYDDKTIGYMQSYIALMMVKTLFPAEVINRMADNHFPSEIEYAVSLDDAEFNLDDPYEKSLLVFSNEVISIGNSVVHEFRATKNG